MTIHDATKSQIICLTKTEGLLPSSSQFLMKRTQQKKDSEASQLIKPWLTRIILYQNEPKLLFETGQCIDFEYWKENRYRFVLFCFFVCLFVCLLVCLFVFCLFVCLFFLGGWNILKNEKTNKQENASVGSHKNNIASATKSKPLCLPKKDLSIFLKKLCIFWIKKTLIVNLREYCTPDQFCDCRIFDGQK